MITVFGTVCLDRVRRVPYLPTNGGYVEIEDEVILLGGEAANTAAHLREWGAELELLGCDPGLGDRGTQVLDLLALHGLTLQSPRTENTRTPICDIYVTPDGDRTMFGQGFSTMAMPDPAQFVPLPGGLFTADPNVGEVARAFARAAIEGGMRAYLMDFLKADDPTPRDGYWQCSTDSVGTRGNTQRNVEWVKRFVADRGCFTILSDGPNGFVAGSPSFLIRAFPPYPAPVVVDSTGAGDAFRAGMLFGLDQGWPISDCLRYASAAGCLSVSFFGGASRHPTRAEVEAHLATHSAIGRQYD